MQVENKIDVTWSPVISLRPLSLALLSMALVGCKVGPNYIAPTAPVTSRYTGTSLPLQTVSANIPGGSAQGFIVAHDIAGDWWALFHSPQINALVTRALAANPDIAAAQATLREARENTRAEQGSLFPQLTADASGEREHNTLINAGGSTYSVVTGTLDLSYTLDVFGGIRRQVEQLAAQADYERFELEATDLTLVANVVEAAISEASLQAQIDTTNEIVKSYTSALNLTRRRLELGGVSRVDVLQQQSLLDAEVATLPSLRKQLEQERNQLAIYLGVLPSQYGSPTLDLASLTLPGELPLSLPSNLVEQRPDIRAYAELLHSATANVGVATANMLPQITLTGEYGGTGSNLSNMFTPAGLLFSIAGALAQPVFEGGTLLARRRSAQAAADVAAAQYSSTVNTAFQSVANALVAIRRDAETLAADLVTSQTAAASLSVAQGQYIAGSGTYLNVLTAEQTDQIARLTLVSAQAARFTDTVALFQALGGGWWHRADVDPQVTQCCGVFHP